MYIYVCVCTHTYIYIYHVHVHIYTYIYIYIHVHIYVPTSPLMLLPNQLKMETANVELFDFAAYNFLVFHEMQFLQLIFYKFGASLNKG